MTKYVFLNMPARGHVNPTFAVVQELVKRGQEVSYYLTEEFRGVGAVFQPYESKMKGPPTAGGIAGLRGGFSTGTAGPRFMLEERGFVLPQVIDRIRAENPDVVVYDFMCTWGKAAVDELHIPAVAMRSTYASNEHFSLMDKMRERMQNTPAMQSMMENMRAQMASQDGAVTHPFAEIIKVFSSVEQLNIIFMPREFQPQGETFDNRYVFVGPSILSRHEALDFPFERLSSTRPILYISLGSIFNNQPEFYKQCFGAFADQPWQVVLSIGKHIDLATLGVVPENFLLAPYVPQLDILPRTSLFVTHAGTNSVMESMYFGVPMVLIPQQPEQEMHARRVVDLGLGMMIDRENVTADTLREAVDRVARDATYRERAQAMQQSIRASGGYQQAADALIQFAQEHVNEHQV